MIKKPSFIIFLFCVLNLTFASPLVYEGDEGPGKGKHIVFIANDHEYRSEETSPLLAKLLAKHLGFKCTVLFGIDEDGHILPGSPSVPHLDTLKEADLAFFFTRFMSLSEEDVQHIVDYLERGGPIIGLRTSTHTFKGQEGQYSIFNFNNNSEIYNGGFGKQVLGNTWDKANGQSHYGSNHSQGGTYTAEEAAKEHPIWTGVESFHAYNGAYKSQPPIDSTPIVQVQVLNTLLPSDDISDKEPVNAGWTRNSYTAPSGEQKEGRVFYSSIGPAEDFLDAGTRRFMMNACMWAVGLEDQITAESSVDILGHFSPSPFYTGGLYREGVTPQSLAGFDSAIMPSDSLYNGIIDSPGKSDSRYAKVFKNRPNLLEKIRVVHPNMSLNFKEKKAPKNKK